MILIMLSPRHFYLPLQAGTPTQIMALQESGTELPSR
jgi:hypothetical protein